MVGSLSTAAVSLRDWASLLGSWVRARPIEAVRHAVLWGERPVTYFEDATSSGCPILLVPTEEVARRLTRGTAGGRLFASLKRCRPVACLDLADAAVARGLADVIPLVAHHVAERHGCAVHVVAVGASATVVMQAAARIAGDARSITLVGPRGARPVLDHLPPRVPLHLVHAAGDAYAVAWLEVLAAAPAWEVTCLPATGDPVHETFAHATSLAIAPFLRDVERPRRSDIPAAAGP